jgi:hypothetical protein
LQNDEITQLDFETFNPKLNSETEWDNGIFFSMSRDSLVKIQSIVKKPSHGIPSGTFAIDMIIEMSRILGMKTLTLTDISQISCDKFTTVSLRKLRILTKSTGWYESKGFKSQEEIYNTANFKKHVHKIHTFPLARFIDNVSAMDVLVRKGIIDRTPMYGDVYTKKGVTSRELTAKEVVGVFNFTSVLLASLKPTHKTLGSAVQHLMTAKKCTELESVIDAILPNSTTFVVLTRVGDAKVPEWKDTESIIFTWRMLESYQSLTKTMT